MNLYLQRIIRQGMTYLAGWLSAHGILTVANADHWTAAATEFAVATILALISFLWSTINAKILKKPNQ